MKERANQMFKGKLLLVMLVLGLLTIVAVVGVTIVQRGKGDETNPYLEAPQPEMIAQETAPEMPQVADVFDAAKETQKGEPAPIKAAVAQNANQGNNLATKAEVGKDVADALVLNFTDTSKMEWPVKGNVLLDYNMDQTTYFLTLGQYKYNPGPVIQSDVSIPVGALTNTRILEVDSNEEVGNYVVIDLGNECTVTCGQSKEVCAVEGEYLKKGQTLGYVSEPTKYYSVEGVNVFLELKHQDKMADLLDYMEQGPKHYRENVDSEK